MVPQLRGAQNSVFVPVVTSGGIGNAYGQVISGAIVVPRRDGDLDAAIAWAAKCPGASNGTMEVRPIWSMQA